MFQDGTSLSDVDAVLLGTGYELRLPFLERGDALEVDPSALSNSSHAHNLVTNLRYLFPIHQHVFSLCSKYPTNALSFIGLPIYVANCPSDMAQSRYVVHSIANSSLLPPRNVMLDQLATEEERLRSLGYDPYYEGHRILPIGQRQYDYQDELIEYLRKQGAISHDGEPYVEGWRRQDHSHLKRGWQRVVSLGIEGEWLRGVETEQDWAGLMTRLERWQADWEEKEGLYYTDGSDIFSS